MRVLATLLSLALLGGGTGARGEEPGHFMIVAPHPAALAAGAQILRAGGSATDAAIAVQMALGVAAPQTSGIGGGAELVHFDGATHAVTAWDGLETAPAATSPDLGAGPASGGQAVGVPGLVPMLEALHREHGHLPWADLMAPAIRLAEQGVPVSAALAEAIAAQRARLLSQPGPRATFFTADGAPLAAGSILTNPDLVQTLRAIATDGANALLRGPIAAEIATTVRSSERPGLVTTDDLAAYSVRRRDAACQSYHGRTVCSTPAPGGGAMLLRALAWLDPLDLAALDPTGPDAARLLIQADDGAEADTVAAQVQQGAATIAIVDAQGNAICMTSNFGRPFGSGLFVRGFPLNAALAAFDPSATGDNQMQPGKRPVTAMAPAFVLDPGRRLQAAIGSTGTAVPDVVLQAVIGAIDWHMDPAQALAQPHVGVVHGLAELEDGTPATRLLPVLQARGQTVRAGAMPSDAAMIAVMPGGLAGAADLRGEGAVAGQ